MIKLFNGSIIYVNLLQQNNSIPLTQEIYENFGYEAPRDFFHSFEMDDCVAGLSFADAADAKAFYQAVVSILYFQNIFIPSLYLYLIYY